MVRKVLEKRQGLLVHENRTRIDENDDNESQSPEEADSSSSSLLCNNTSYNMINGIVSASPQILPAIQIPGLFDPKDEDGTNNETETGSTPEKSFLSYENSSNNDVYQTPIPLSPPPSMSIGNTYGGNQSYIRINKTLRLPESSATTSVTYSSSWNSPINSDTNIMSQRQRDSREPGDVGLSNLGNTCFMNSGLQCLIHTPTLVEHFLDGDKIQKSFTDKRTQLVSEFHAMIRGAWTGSSSVLTLTEFKTVLGNINALFKDNRQHDCQEFLAITLDALHEQLKLLKGNCVSEKLAKLKNECKRKRQSYPLDEENRTTKMFASANHKPIPSLSKVDADSSTESSMMTPVLTKSNCNNEIDTNLSESCEQNDTIVPMDIKTGEVDLATKAADYWKEHMAANNTVIASTFQGMYKSTVRCSHCNYVSVTYEPFMYLSLPIPRIVDRQLAVTIISMKDRRPHKTELSLNILDSVAKLKQEAAKSINVGDCPLDIKNKFVVALVSNHQISSILLDDTLQIKNMNERGRNIYVFELNSNFDEEYGLLSIRFPDFSEQVTSSSQIISPNPSQSEMNPSTYLDEEWEHEDLNLSLPPLVKSNQSSADLNSSPDKISDGVIENDIDNASEEELIVCSICLEEFKAADLQQHNGCDCKLCDDCLQKCINHYAASKSDKILTNEKYLSCAVCRSIVDSNKEFIPVGTKILGQTILLTIPVLFRNDPDPDTNNNSSAKTRLFGYPWVIKVPSRIPAGELIAYLSQLNPFPQCPSRFLIVTYDGNSCGKCSKNSTNGSKQCPGCEISKEGIVLLNQKNIALLISYSNLSLEQMTEIQPNDMSTVKYGAEVPPLSNLYRNQDEPTIDIHDCLRSFSEIEHLDSQNPWHCPECDKNQCATKAMSICHLPDYLIVYLKRFVFLDHASNKLNNRLKFPLTGLDVGDYMAEEFSGKDYTYDLYSCVCHFGGATSGHYTAFGKNPTSGIWHNFNDSVVLSQDPKEEEYSSAYILFYQRRGVKHDIPGVLKKSRAMADRSNSFHTPRPVGVIPPNHLSGGNYFENSVPSSTSNFIDIRGPGKFPIPTLPVHSTDGNSLDELSLTAGAITNGLDSPVDSTNYPFHVANMKFVMGSENDENEAADTSTACETRSEELPILRSQQCLTSGGSYSINNCENWENPDIPDCDSTAISSTILADTTVTSTLDTADLLFNPDNARSKTMNVVNRNQN